jgi:hypothetical protein
MNFKTTLALVLLLSVVGGYFYFVEYGNISQYEAHEQQLTIDTTRAVGEPVFNDATLTADLIDRIQISRGGRDIMVENEEGQWYQTQPVRFALDSIAPASVALQFTELRYIQKIDLAPGSPGSPDAADAPSSKLMGLDKPRAVVTVWVGDKSWTLKLGRQGVDNHGYVQVQGEETAYVVDPALHGAVLDQQINDWRSKSLDIPSASTIEHIVLQQDGPAIGLTKSDGRWRVDGEGLQRASEEAINDLIAAAGRLSINGFTADNPDSLALYGLDNPYLSLILRPPPLISPADDTGTQTYPVTRRLILGRIDLQGQYRYAAWTRDDEPTLVVFTVSISNADALARTADELRDPRVIVAESQDVRDLAVQQAGVASLHLIRDPQTGYRFGDPQPGYEVDYSTAHTLIQQLCDLTTTRYTAELSELGAPIAQVQLGVATGSGKVNFSVYDSGDDRIIVNQGEGVGYVVGADELDRLLGPTLGLRKRMVLDLMRDSIIRVAITRPDGVTYEFTPGVDDAGWILAGHEQFEDEAFDTLLGSLSPLRALEWLADPITPKSERIDWIEVTIEISDESPKTLSINPTNGSAVLSGNDSAFVLPQLTIDRFNAEYRDRTVIAVPIENINSVKLTSVSTGITVSREGQRFVSDRGEVDQAMAAGVFDALAGLRVQRYVAPLNLRPQDIDFSIEMTSVDGEIWTLNLVNSEDEPTTATLTAPGDVSDGDAQVLWFTLDRSVADRLRAPLTDAEALIK